MKTQNVKLTYLHFQFITVSFYPYLFISIYGKALLIFMLSLTCLVIPINNIITPNNLHGSIHIQVTSHLGETLRHLIQYLPQVFVCYHMMMYYAFFSLGSDRWGKDLAPLWGHLTICPPLQQFQLPSITQLELSSMMSLKAWGEKQKVHHNITYLLVLAKEEVTRDRRYGLLTIWVNPC